MNEETNMPVRYCSEDDYTLLSIREVEWPSDRRSAGEFSDEEIARIETAFAELDWVQALLEERCPKFARYK